MTIGGVGTNTNPIALLKPEDIKAAARPIEAFLGCGVYFLLDAEGMIVYVGQSLSVGSRVRDHAKRATKHSLSNIGWGNFRSVAVHWCLPSERQALERAYIHRFQPKFNLAGVSEDGMARTLRKAAREGRLDARVDELLRQAVRS